MALTKDAPTKESVDPPARPSKELWSRPVVLVLAVAVVLVALSWGFIQDPTITAPTRDPAWYTWRANVVAEHDPVSIVGGWGPFSAFSGGYRVSVPLLGALLHGVAGVETFQFSALLMIGAPVLAGLAMGVFGYRTKRDPLLILLTLLASVGLFLTTPYVGYMDNIFMLFVLATLLAFVPEAQTSWPARSACFLLGVLAAFTHPTTCVLFGMSMLGVFGWRILTARFHFADALRRHGPALMSTGFGMIFGLVLWVVGIWGESAPLADAALPPPYAGDFFNDRLLDWILSMKPLITFSLAGVAIAATIWISRRRREPGDTYSVTSIFYLLPYAALLFTPLNAGLTGDDNGLPLYRFMNATTAIMILTGLGAWFTVRWLMRRPGSQRAAGIVGAMAVVAALVFVFVTGWQTWVKPTNQWIDQDTRTAMTSVREIAERVDGAPIVFLENFGNEPTAYGWGKTFTNVARTAIPGDDVGRSAAYWGSLDNFLAGEPTNFSEDRVPTVKDKTMSEGYLDHMNAVVERQGGTPPILFVVREFSKGANAELFPEDGSCLDEAGSPRREIVPLGCDVGFVSAEGVTTTPPQDAVEAARQAGVEQRRAFDEHPGPFGDPVHLLRVLFGLAALLVVPGLLAARWFETRGFFEKFGLVPGISLLLVILSAIVVAAVWRGPFDEGHGWASVGVASAVGAGLSLRRATVLRPMEKFGGFFNRMFAVFSSTNFAALMGVQFLIQAADGVIRGSIAKSIAFGGQEGFDITTVPSPKYLLQLVLALYVPYTFLSPFIGVFIDRFERRRVLAMASIATAVIVGGAAVAVLLPLGSGSSEGNIGATIALVGMMLVVQACVRIMLAVKSAAVPGVLSGRDLLQGNGLSQAGGAAFQVLGAGFAFGAGAALPSWIVVSVGAGMLAISALIAKRIQQMEATSHATSFGQEAKRVLSDIWAGLKQVAARPPAAIGLSSFQMLRYQFWGFSLGVFALHATTLIKGGDADLVALGIVGGGGFVGGALGLVLAQTVKDRIPPVRLLVASMTLLGGSAVVFGAWTSLSGFAILLFCGFLGFFVGKISADTIVQQSMPDDFRGRAFALFDIAYNLGFIMPALILYVVWASDRVRLILISSGVVFLALTALVAAWSRRHAAEFAAQDDIEAQPAVAEP